jgi:hypothetical protein
MTVRIDTQSRSVSFIAIFASLAIVLDSIPGIPGFYTGVWDSWLFIMSPLFGILLGPLIGAASISLGGFVGHLIYFRDPFELIFMWGAPVGAAISGLVYQKKWREVFSLYSVLLGAYFLTPVSWELPLWGIWDIIMGFVVMIIFSLFCILKLWKNSGNLDQKAILLFATVIGLETDVLFRVFILIPGQTYELFYGLSVEALQLLWWGAGFIIPMKIFMATIVVLTIGISLLRVMSLDEGHESDVLTVE